MNELAGQNENGVGGLLDEQIALLGVRRREVEDLLARGERVDDPLTDDLVGIVLVLRAALLVDGTSGPVRDGLRDHEREARELLNVALRHRRRC